MSKQDTDILEHSNGDNHETAFDLDDSRITLRDGRKPTDRYGQRTARRSTTSRRQLGRNDYATVRVYRRGIAAGKR